MQILVACEESQAVTIELRKLGHEAYSCDLLDCSGGHLEWHIKADVLPLLNGNCCFMTMNDEQHILDGKWDMIIAHPPCTYLSNAGARHLYKGGQLNLERYKKGLEGKEFFMKFINADCERIAVENPVSSLIYKMPQFSQEIQPYYFGEPYSKKTRLWLKGLKKLEPTNILKEFRTFMPSNTGGLKRGQHHLSGIPKNQIESSKTFIGIAKAMAEQWAGNIQKS